MANHDYEVMREGNAVCISSAGYNSLFDTSTGILFRWGKTFEDDPYMCPFGPEILDIEISTGSCSMACGHCYKGNLPSPGKNMPLDRYAKILSIMPETLSQVALGITDADANPDFISILEFTRARNVVPNYTTSGRGLTEEILRATKLYCGAVAVSVYPGYEQQGFDTLRRLSGLRCRDGLRQVNVHLLYHNTNTDWILNTLDVLANSHRGYYDSVVLLKLKAIGRGASYSPPTYEQFSSIATRAFDNRMSLGFDSCSAHWYIQYANENGLAETTIFAEPCESSLFSLYVNTDGFAFPCSFSEEILDPVNILACDSIEHVWESSQLSMFREQLLSNGRKCVLGDIA